MLLYICLEGSTFTSQWLDMAEIATFLKQVPGGLETAASLHASVALKA